MSGSSPLRTLPHAQSSVHLRAIDCRGPVRPILVGFGLAGVVGTLQKASVMMDIAFILSSIGLGYISWVTWKEQA